MLRDILKYESDKSIPDGSFIIVGERLPNKVWRVRNIGASTWREGYRLTFFSGERFGAPPYVPLPNLAPGESGLVVISGLIAPEQTGVFSAEWRPCRPDGTPFPAHLTINVHVLPVPAGEAK